MRTFARAAAALILVCLRPAALTADSSPGHLPTLLTANRAHSLPQAEAERRYPVRLKGVITYYDSVHDPGYAFVFLHDKTGSIFVTFPKEPRLPIHPGELVQVEGVSGPGRYAPIVEQARFRRLGEARLPKPTHSSLAQMLTGSQDGKWLSVKGVVRAAEIESGGSLRLDIQADIGFFPTLVMSFGAVKPAELVDATVLLTGNCAPYFNQSRQLVGARIFVPDISLVKLLRAPADPFSLPVQRITSLLRYRPDLDEVHRRRIRGTVTLSLSRHLVIQDGREGVLVEPVAPVNFTLGDEVDTVGFPAAGEYSPILRQTLIRPTGRQNEILPVAATPGQILAGSYDMRLVKIEGRLVDHRTGALAETLFISSQGSLIESLLETGGNSILTDLRDGSYLQLTGVCSMQVDQDRVPRSFRILLRSPRDVLVLRAPSWWSVAHTVYVLLGTVAVTFAVIAWVVILRRRVAQQTDVIRRQLEEAAKLKEKAEAASRAKSDFLANMSHEIRTPMNGVLGMIDLALQSQPTPEQFEFLDLARSSAYSLLSVIGDILDFSRIEAGKLDLCPVDFELPDLIHEIVRSFTPTANGKGVHLVSEFGAGVLGKVRGDPARLRQVLVNLIGNALKFTDQGSVTILTELDGRQGDSLEFRFSVIDTGIGIPADKQQLVFGAFSQADASTTRKYGGTGLGLAISSRLVQLMGGQIALESEPGRGSCFHFTALLAAAEEPEPPFRQLDSSPNLNPSRLHILVAEDNPVNRRLVEKQLERLGYSVTLVPNGLEALRMIETHRFDLALMDVQMPEMDGLEATRSLRRKEASSGDHLPVVALTAHAMEGDEAMCLSAGMDAYVTKPIIANKLHDAMLKALAAKALASQSQT